MKEMEKTMILTVLETSKILKISKNKVYDLIRAGILPAMNLGGLKIRVESISKFLADYEGYDLSDISNICKLEMNLISA